jgi:hypothetical protein
MAIDIQEGYNQIGGSIQKNQTYKKLSSDYKKLKKKTGTSFEKKKSKITKRHKKEKTKFDKWKKKQNSQLDELLKIKFLSADNLFTDGLKDLDPNKLEKHKKGGDVKKYIIGKFITALNELKPKILSLLEDEVLKTAGCSDDQTYQPNQDLYINVKSIDFLGLLKVDPNSDIGKISYENENLTFPKYPFAMNKELYQRTQSINQNFSVQYSSNYQGVSLQDLFDISYTEIDNNNVTGNYFKVTPKQRVSGQKIKEFIKDYYKSIEIIDFKNIFANLMNILTGAISIEKGDGKNDLGDFYKVSLIVQRILGLCFDGNKEIDVSGSAKISENDNINDSFFEFDEIETLFIDQSISDTLNGVIEFEECQTIKLPIDTSAIINSINNLIFVPGSNNNNTINNATNITDSLTKNPDWLPLQINIDESMIKEFPKAVLFSVLSPKVILPLAIVLLALGNESLNLIKSYVDFFKKFKDFAVNVTSKIYGIFIKIIFDLVVQDIKQLISTITIDIKLEKNKKTLSVIFALTQILLKIADIVTDVRECKSVIDNLLKLLKLASRGFGNQIPLPLLLATRFLSGFSSTRAYLNVIEEFEKLGIPTGPLPDGSPNEFVLAMKAVIDSIDKEEAENGQVQIAIDPLSITPIGTTLPSVSFGKKL